MPPTEALSAHFATAPDATGPHKFHGSCHCGGIAVTLAFTRPAEETQTRSCQCSFCTRQGALTVSDPAGRAVIEIHAGHFSTYKFGTQSGTSLICGNCGVYAGVMLQDGEGIWSTVNARGLAIPDFKDRAGVPMQYEHETVEARIARRKQRWTPTEIRFRV